MGYTFEPARVLVMADALAYPLGQALYDRFRSAGVETRVVRGRVTGIPGTTAKAAYAEAKRTLVVAVRKDLRFQGSKPSADYALPLVSGCPGHCQYCYLQTTLGPKPAVRVYVNLDEILARAHKYIHDHAPRVTTFEGACTSDPLAVEHLTGGLARTIAHFAAEPLGRFRFVTKYDAVAGLLNLAHGGHTRIRVSLNTAAVIARWEAATTSLSDRVRAAAQLAAAGYPVGFIIAPIFLEGDWQPAYDGLFTALQEALDAYGTGGGWPDMTFEFITHRFTPPARRLILDRFPNSELPLAAEERQWKWGQFGYGKYLYKEETRREAETFFREQVSARFPGAQIAYFI